MGSIDRVDNDSITMHQYKIGPAWIKLDAGSALWSEIKGSAQRAWVLPEGLESRILSKGSISGVLPKDPGLGVLSFGPIFSAY